MAQLTIEDFAAAHHLQLIDDIIPDREGASRVLNFGGPVYSSARTTPKRLSPDPTSPTGYTRLCSRHRSFTVLK
jgi:hypothetical protein